MARREDLLRREAEAWHRLAAALDGLTPRQLERPGLNGEGWSIKDLLWHVAVWCDDAAETLHAMAAGTWDGRDLAAEVGTDRVNREALERSREMGLEPVRAAWWRDRGRMLEAFGALEDVTPRAAEWFDEAGPAHYEEHLEELEAWVAELRSAG
ncbi:MAG TPA: maleylpyruvate isomerase N-terminal domain-containing protein [Actinomycetota bacterium]|nr:maleylpyruvate isomerase N-terminal domain-containing protein [Actinomycetota bacterium]